VDSAARRDFSIPGRSLNTVDGIATAGYRVITPDYFAVVRTSLREGRSFGDQDGPDAAGVAIVNEKFARTYFANEEPVGKQIRLENRYISTSTGMQWPGSQIVQIVGVASDSRQITPFMDLHDLYEAASPEIFVPFLQHPEGGRDMALLVRTSVSPETISGAVRNEVLGIDRQQPVYDVQTLEAMTETAFGPTRLCLVILGIFAGAALLTACVGLYAIVSYSVTQRRHEIGIRMALGAKPTDALRLVVGEGMPVIVAGLLVGLFASLGVTRLMSSLLYGVLPNDVATLLSVGAILTFTAMLAVYIPARRAIGIDPMEALRYE
jgi:putative ABC transport system permease protein